MIVCPSGSSSWEIYENNRWVGPETTFEELSYVLVEKWLGNALWYRSGLFQVWGCSWRCLRFTWRFITVPTKNRNVYSFDRSVRFFRNTCGFVPTGKMFVFLTWRHLKRVDFLKFLFSGPMHEQVGLDSSIYLTESVTRWLFFASKSTEADSIINGNMQIVFVIWTHVIKYHRSVWRFLSKTFSRDD
jgi:hypothetical protein